MSRAADMADGLLSPLEKEVSAVETDVGDVKAKSLAESPASTNKEAALGSEANANVGIARAFVFAMALLSLN